MMTNIDGYQEGVFTFACKKCSITSYIGFQCTNDAMERQLHGLIGFARRRNNDNETARIPDWLHCPVCDEAYSDKDDVNEVITDITARRQP